MCKDIECWKVIEGFPNYYISTFGRVFSLKSLRFLKQRTDMGGYIVVALSEKNMKKTKKVHRLVALTFIENPNEKQNVDHINNVPTDNRLENLRFATKTENGRNSKVSTRSSTKVKGVSYNAKKNMFQAYITVDYIMIHLGWYKTLEEAQQVRVKKANDVFGDFTNTCEKM